MIADTHTICADNDGLPPTPGGAARKIVPYVLYGDREARLEGATPKGAKFFPKSAQPHRADFNIDTIVTAVDELYATRPKSGGDRRGRARVYRTEHTEGVSGSFRHISPRGCFPGWEEGGRGGSGLVIGSATVDEQSRGHCEEDDRSGAVRDRVGGVSETDLFRTCTALTMVGATSARSCMLISAGRTRELKER